jgi:hypothetical protein
VRPGRRFTLCHIRAPPPFTVGNDHDLVFDGKSAEVKLLSAIEGNLKNEIDILDNGLYEIPDLSYSEASRLIDKLNADADDAYNYFSKNKSTKNHDAKHENDNNYNINIVRDWFIICSTGLN